MLGIEGCTAAGLSRKSVGGNGVAQRQLKAQDGLFHAILKVSVVSHENGVA